MNLKEFGIIVNEEQIEEKLSENLAAYLNDCLVNREKLPYKQNLLEQIYLPKEDSLYVSFDNSRPITKSSPIYKLLDCILNERLKEEIYGEKEKICKEQAGFRKGIGCEMNILKMMENLRSMKKSKGKKNMWSFFLDLKSAFDSVDHETVFQKMKDS